MFRSAIQTSQTINESPRRSPISNISATYLSNIKSLMIMSTVATAADTKRLKRLSDQARIAYDTLEEFTSDELVQISCSAHFLPQCRNEVTLAKIFLKIRRALQRNHRQEQLRRAKLKWQKVTTWLIQFRLTWQTATSWVGLLIFVGICVKAFTERQPLLVYAEIVNSFSDSPLNIVLALIALIGLAVMMYKASSCLCLDSEDGHSYYQNDQELLQQIERSERHLKKKHSNDQSVEKLVAEFDRAYCSLREKISCRIEQNKQEIDKLHAQSDDTSSDSTSNISNRKSMVRGSPSKKKH